MTQEQIYARLTAAVVRFAQLMQLKDAGHGNMLSGIADSLKICFDEYNRITSERTKATDIMYIASVLRAQLAITEEQLDMLAETLPPDVRCASLALRARINETCIKKPSESQLFEIEAERAAQVFAKTPVS